MLPSYIRYRSYAQAQSDSPNTVLNGADFDTDFDRIKTFADSVSSAIADVRRDDGQLVNETVGLDQLKSEVFPFLNKAVTFKGAWVTATVYAVNDFVSQSSNGYVCLVAHTAGTFATDLAAGKWQLLSTTGSTGPAGSGYGATSVTSLAIGTGSKIFTTLAGLAYTAGARVRASSAGGPTNYMEGVVTSYSGTTLTVNVDLTHGSGTKTDWDINLAGEQGSVGPSLQRRQTTTGPVSSTTGLPNFLPSSATGLSLTSQNVSTTAPFMATAANGVSSTTGRQQDAIGVASANLTWGSLTNSSTLYLYVTIGDDGTLTTGFTSIAPVYQWGGVPSTTNGTFTFNIAEQKGYMGNGTTAPQVNIVFVGECVTSGGNVSSTVAYAYNGIYDSGFTATLPSTIALVSKNHNIGVPNCAARVIFECTTANVGYSVGDQILAGGAVTTVDSAGAAARQPAVVITKNTVAFGPGNASTPWVCLNPTSGAVSNLTGASWKYKMIVDRGW